MMQKKGWKDIPIGGIIDKPGTAVQYKSGDWRTQRPVVDRETCTDCLTCWMFCPDSAVRVKDEKIDHIDYDHCKGCGICASVCPVECITMEKE